jgi:hypothetical protein
MLVIHSSKRYLQLWRNKKQKLQHPLKLCTSYKNAYAMTQEIKIILTLRERIWFQILNHRKVLETCPEKRLYMRAQSLSCSACFRNPVRIPVQIISQRNCIQLPRFCHWQLQKKNYKRRAAGLRSVHYKRRNRVFWGFNADYYDLNWLSNNDNVQIVYVDNDTPTRDRIKFIDHGVGLGGERLINYFSGILYQETK